MKAIKIKMRPGYRYSKSCSEISEIYLTGQLEGWFSSEFIHNWLLQNPGSIIVRDAPHPELLPALSRNGEKYVKTEPVDTTADNLLRLPREQ